MSASIYSDITRVETTGTSQETANQDNLNFKGVAASHRLMATDLQRVNRYKSLTQQVARAHQIDPAIIGAIISRESRGGNALVDGYGDYGNAFGLMQVDVRYHSPVGGWDSKERLMQATGILVKMIEAIQRKFPYWTKEQQLKGRISAYNMGPGNVESYNNVDARTTGRDYSNDVVARAQWLKKNGF